MNSFGSTQFTCYCPPVALLNQPSALPQHISLEPLNQYENLPTQSIEDFLPTEVSETVTRPNNFLEKTAGKRPGRKFTLVNLTLRQFTRSQERFMDQPPKLENIRYRIMRTMKKVLRRIYERKPLIRSGLLGFPSSFRIWRDRYKSLQRYALAHKPALQSFAELSNGPKVDQCRKTRQTQFSTYNERYMEHVFGTEEVREAYLLFIALVFSEAQSESLSERFKIKCCASIPHTPECEDKWTAFRKLLDSFLGTQIVK